MSATEPLPYPPPTLASVSRSNPAVILATDRLSAGDLAAWRALADRAVEPNPFFCPEFVLAAAESAGRPAELIVAREGGRWTACMPLQRASRWRRLPLRTLGPWRPDLAYLATPLVDRDAVLTATDAIAELVCDGRRAAQVVLDPISPAGPVAAGLSAALGRRGAEPIVYAAWERAAATRRLESTYVKDTLSSRRLKEIRRCWRALGKHLGGELAVTDRAGDRDAYERFLALESSGWKGTSGTALACSAANAGFFRAACGALADQGRLQLLALEAGGRTAAMQCNLLAGNTLFGFKVAYDPELARFAPGALLEVASFDVFHDDTTALAMDSCAASDNEMINRIWPERTALETWLVPTGAARAALVRPALRAEALARRVARRSPRT